jgi:hypothetical protein
MVRSIARVPALVLLVVLALLWPSAAVAIDPPPTIPPLPPLGGGVAIWLATSGQVTVSMAVTPTEASAGGTLTFSGRVMKLGPPYITGCIDMSRTPPRYDPACACRTPTDCPVGGTSWHPVPGAAVGIYRPDACDPSCGSFLATAWTGSDGRYSVTLPAEIAGTHTYKAIGPNGSFATTQVTVLAVPTETSVSQTPIFPALGASVQLLAVIYPGEVAASGAGLTGTVTFSEGTTQLCTATVVTYPWDPGQALAMCDTTFAKVGPHAYTGTYGGDGLYAPSTGAWTVTVKHGTTLRLAGTPNPSQVGKPVTFTATLTTSVVATPTGTVTFAVDQPEDPSRQVEVAVAANGVATWATSALAPGVHKIYATYNGDANFAPTWVMINKSLTTAGFRAAADEVVGTRWVEIAQAVHWPFTGFFSPVDNDGVLNVAKAGSAIPVKFSLGGDQGLDIFAAGYPQAVSVACDTGEASDGIETYAAGGSGLQYDPVTDQYTYVWKTQKAWSGLCYEFQMQLADGSMHVADFQFK